MRASVLVRGGGGVAVGRVVVAVGVVGVGLGEDGHRLGGVVGVEDDPEALVGVGRVPGDRGDDDDLLLGGGEDVAQALGDAGADLADGRLAAPAVEATGLFGSGSGRSLEPPSAVFGRLVLVDDCRWSSPWLWPVAPSRGRLTRPCSATCSTRWPTGSTPPSAAPSMPGPQGLEAGWAP